MNKTLILDFGNVLTENQNKNAYNFMLEELEVPAGDFFTAWASYRLDYDKGVLDSRQFWTKVLGDLKIQNGEKLAAENWERYLEADISSFNYPREPLIRFIQKCIAEGMNTAILSNMPPKVGKMWDRLWPWLNSVPVRIWSGDVGMVKPHPDIYRLAERETRANPETILFVDDLKINIDAAAQRGWGTYHFTDSNQAIADLQKALT